MYYLKYLFVKIQKYNELTIKKFLRGNELSFELYLLALIMVIITVI